MEEPKLREVLTVARAFESLGWLLPSDWVDICVALLILGVEDDDVIALACMDAAVTGWEVDQPVANLYERYGISSPAPKDSVDVAAQALAMDLRARSVAVTGPMIRMLAKVAGPHYESDLANQALGAEEYLDCTCVASVDPSFEAELENLPPLDVPDDLIRLTTRRLRSTLPASQPPHSH
ncbi:hypothetical protein [Aeromicrobium sp. JJY06]|uniref:hypothetical protein n=1 Tax=Aeromicrobium sp. JJY06 TaxID=3373478 RepID=UPI00376EB57F